MSHRRPHSNITIVMKPIPFPDPVIRRVILRTPDATLLAAFYQTLLGLQAQPGPTDRQSVSMIDPRSGATLLTLIEDRGARPPPQQAPGLFHIAFLFAGLDDWRTAVKRALSLADGQCGASDHGVSWAVYLTDPDGNGIELAWDKPANEWPWHGDQIRMVTRPLPLRGLLSASGPEPASPGAFGIGHLHLQVAGLRSAEIYQSALGLQVTQADYPGALFLARDGYHHHLALNVWRTDPRVVRPPNASGLVGWDMARAEDSHTCSWRDPIGHDVNLM